MRNVIGLLIGGLLCFSCHANHMEFTIKRTIVKAYENDTVKILVADNNDFIEAFKDHNNPEKCRKISLGKKTKFRVIPVSDLSTHRNNFIYIFNDSTYLKYNRYFGIYNFQNYCVENK
ncbi:hypothetical protein [Chryseobacterium contaminans]|uniref:hypothetical protein n=1 Tax=Chryseobacterium contaminans TaxID=1423959 RepID=UPI003015B2FD